MRCVSVPFQITSATCEPCVCGVVMSQDVLSNAPMKHANQILSRMDFSVECAIDCALSIFDTKMTNATLSQIFMLVGPIPGSACMHPELTSKVSHIIHQCWNTGESTKAKAG